MMTSHVQIFSGIGQPKGVPSQALPVGGIYF